MLIVPHAASLTSAALVRRHGRYGTRKPGRRSKVIKWSAAPGYGPSPSIPRPFWINFNFENIVALASSLATVGFMVADTQRLMSPQHTRVSQGPTRSFPILLGPAHATSFDASSEGGRGKAWLAFVGAVFAMGMAGASVMVSGARAGSSSSSGNGNGARGGRGNEGGQRGNNVNRLPVRGSSPPPPQGPPSPSISTSSRAVRPIKPRDKRSKRRGSSDPDPPPGGGGTSLGVHDGKKEVLIKGVFVGLFWWVCNEALRRRDEDEDEDEGGQEQDEDEEEEEEDEDVICTDVIVHSTANVKEYSFDFLNPTSTTDFITLDELIGVASLTGSDTVEMNMDDLVDALLDDEPSPSTSTPPSPPAPICTFDIPPVPSALLVASNAKVNPPSLNNTVTITTTTNSVHAKPSKVSHALQATTLITVLWIGYLAVLCWRVVYSALCRVVRRVGYGVQWVCGMVGIIGMGQRAMEDVGGDEDSEDERGLSDGEDDDEDEDDNGDGGWEDGDEDDDGDGDEVPEWSFDSEEEGEEVADEDEEIEDEDVCGVEDVERQEEDDEEDVDLEHYVSLLLDLEECDLEQYLALLSDDEEEEEQGEEGRYRHGELLGVIYEEEECEEEVVVEEEEEDEDDMYGDVCVYEREEEPQHVQEDEEQQQRQEEEEGEHQEEDADVCQRASSSTFAFHWDHLRPSTPLSPTTSTHSEYTSSVPHSPECGTPLSLPSLPSLQSVLSELSGDEEDDDEEIGGSAAPVHAQLEPEQERRPSPSRVPPSRSLSPASLPTPAPAHSSVPQCAQRTPPRPPITPRSIPLPLSPTPTPRSVPLPPSPTADTNSNADTNETEDPNTKTIPDGRRRRTRRRKRRGG